MTDQPQYPSYPGPEQPETPPPGQAPTPPPGYQPPPPPGYQPPPPPGYQPPPGYGQPPPGYGQPPPTNPYESQTGGPPVGVYASWWSRVGAQLLDGLIALAVIIVPLIVGLVIGFKDVETDPVTDEITGGVAASGILILVLTLLLYLGFDLWNRGVRVGKRGQSFGKQIVGIRIVRATDGQLLGGGGGFLRWLMTLVFGFVPCGSLLDVLWPLWDDRHQTLHDKVVSTISVRT